LESPEEIEPPVRQWSKERNEREVKVQWRFTTADAHIKLCKLYPSFEGWWTNRLRENEARDMPVGS
jgi:hypothetical protein